MKKGYKVLMKVWETNTEIALVCGISSQAVGRWKHSGVPRKRRQTLVDASNGKIKSIDQLRGG